MADQIILTDVSVEVDDEALPVNGNTVVFTEGLGERMIKAASQGGKPIMISSEDISTKVSTIKFSVPASIAMIDKTRDIAVAAFGRVIRVSGTDAAGNRLARTFKSAILTNNAEKAIQNEGEIPLEFSSAPAVVG